ncbi:helix-turn-helix domain-containing protein [Lacticaseibacillus parakribbianus]|uniref:helix-turn-helix domain-containing protein n=1 Tax=Lacticaseibacillus parakribbianus TaxID=2970927 RepID=UPI0021CB6C0B|nr:helix-turn-helix domain-containing protein [Lacticaseibacillus parakribbianus]
MPRSKYTVEEKLAFLAEFRHSNLGPKRFEREHGLSEHSVERWQARYERDGLEGLSEAKQNNHYSSALKLAMVLAYQNGEGTLNELALQYGLRSEADLCRWISKYNEDKTLTASPIRKQVPTMSRKTTFEERIEVVEYVTKDKHSYAEAADHFQVSYQQARSWVLKAKDGGYEALVDNRGHHKAQADLTENEKLRLEVRRLKAELADKELVEAFLKKLQELQRRG